MRSSGDPRAQLMLVAVGLTLLVAGGLYMTGSPGENNAAEAKAEPANGSVVVGEVQNNFTERAVLHVIVVDEYNTTVSALPSVLDPGRERGPHELPCSDGDATAALLWVAFRALGESEAEDDVFLPLEPSDCQEGGGATFNVTATTGGTVTVES